MTPPYKGWKDEIRRDNKWKYTWEGDWAPEYLDKNDDVVYAGLPHFLLMPRKDDVKMYDVLQKHLIERQEDLPEDLSYIDKQRPALDYLRWYEGWKKKGLKIKPAGIYPSFLPPEEHVAKNNFAVEFVQKVDYLSTLKNGEKRNGNVKKTSFKESCKFVNSLVDYFTKNPFER